MTLPADELALRARKVRLVLLDVDGVLTDGAIRMHSNGSEAKTFHIRDGAAIVWAQREGLRVGFLSGRRSPATSRRAAELGIEIVLQGGHDKRALYDRALASEKVSDEDVAYMGDDLLDLPVLCRVGLSAAPQDAASDVRSRVHWVSRHAGGRGAVRELIELILNARGRWKNIVAEHLT